MSFPTFKDLDKCPADLINDDFDSKFSLKIKTPGPFNTTVTTTTSCDGHECCSSTHTCKLTPKLAVKYAHPSGFTLEKFEATSNDKGVKHAVETSLVNVAPGLKLEFKGNDTDKADLSFTYTIPAATITGEADVLGFNTAKASVCAGANGITGGASVEFKPTAFSTESTSVDVGAGYKLANLFFGVRANKNFGCYSALWKYDGIANTVLAGKVCRSKDTNAIVVGSYQCNRDTTIKVKADTANGGVLYASVKQQFPSKFSVIGSAEVPSSFTGIKFGLNATLG